jgi:trans-aconitate 2-methyltransferase
MTVWNPQRYLQFSRERELPCRDLINRIAGAPLETIVDLGCGPGNSTGVIREAFPHAEVIGVDSSPEMLSAAKARLPGVKFVQADIGSWACDPPVDLIFSNAALQWVADHRDMLPRLASTLKPGGYLAVQMPYRDDDSPISRVFRAAEASERWKVYFKKPVRTWSVQQPSDYYRWLCGSCSQIDLWLIDYYHPLPHARAVIDWYRGTGLRPYLDALPSEGERHAFLQYCGDTIKPMYPVQSDGCILFSIRRLFITARQR